MTFEGKPYVKMKAYWNIIDTVAREERQKAINAGYDADYIMKSSKELGGKEPSFEMKNGNLVFVQKKKSA